MRFLNRLKSQLQAYFNHVILLQSEEAYVLRTAYNPQECRLLEKARTFYQIGTVETSQQSELRTLGNQLAYHNYLEGSVLNTLLRLNELLEFVVTPKRERE